MNPSEYSAGIMTAMAAIDPDKMFRESILACCIFAFVILILPIIFANEVVSNKNEKGDRVYDNIHRKWVHAYRIKMWILMFLTGWVGPMITGKIALWQMHLQGKFVSWVWVIHEGPCATGRYVDGAIMLGMAAGFAAGILLLWPVARALSIPLKAIWKFYRNLRIGFLDG